jgi:hypothetical protein
MLRLVSGPVECLWDEVLPVEVRELPDDVARLDKVLADQLLLFPIAQGWQRDPAALAIHEALLRCLREHLRRCVAAPSPRSAPAPRADCAASSPEGHSHRSSTPRRLHRRCQPTAAGRGLALRATGTSCSRSAGASLSQSRSWAPGACDRPDGLLPIGGLLVGGVSLDRVQARIAGQSFDHRHRGANPSPVWVDVRGDAPRMVGWPYERGSAPTLELQKPPDPGVGGRAPAPDRGLGERSVKQKVGPRGGRGPRGTSKVGHRRADSGNPQPSQRPK